MQLHPDGTLTQRCQLQRGLLPAKNASSFSLCLLRHGSAEEFRTLAYKGVEAV